jgi:hypothetical protein
LTASNAVHYKKLGNFSNPNNFSKLQSPFKSNLISHLTKRKIALQKKGIDHDTGRFHKNSMGHTMDNTSTLDGKIT